MFLKIEQPTPHWADLEYFKFQKGGKKLTVNSQMQFLEAAFKAILKDVKTASTSG